MQEPGRGMFPTYDPIEERIRKVEAQLSRLLLDPRISAIMQGPLPVSDSFMQFRRTGSSSYYVPGALGGVPSPDSLAILANRIYAQPFYPARHTYTDQLSINVTTAQSGNARLGIYEDNGDIYPGTLVVDFGTVSVSSTGIKTVGSRQGLTRSLKWIVIVSDVGPTLSSVTAAAAWPILGTSNFSQLLNFWRANFTYASLPVTFPTAGASRGQGGPLILVRMAE